MFPTFPPKQCQLFRQSHKYINETHGTIERDKNILTINTILQVTLYWVLHTCSQFVLIFTTSLICYGKVYRFRYCPLILSSPFVKKAKIKRDFFNTHLLRVIQMLSVSGMYSQQKQMQYINESRGTIERDNSILTINMILQVTLYWVLHTCS